MKYKVGDRVKVKSLEWYDRNSDEYGDVRTSSGLIFFKKMASICGTVLTIDEVDEDSVAYHMKGNLDWWLSNEMIEGLADDDMAATVGVKYRVRDKVRIKSFQWYKANVDKDGNLEFMNGMSLFGMNDMEALCNRIVTIKGINCYGNYIIKESPHLICDEIIEEKFNGKYKVGDKVLINGIDWYNQNKNIYGNVEIYPWFRKEMKPLCGKVVTINGITDEGNYQISGSKYLISDAMIDTESIFPRYNGITTYEGIKTFEDAARVMEVDVDDWNKAHSADAPEDIAYFKLKLISEAIEKANTVLTDNDGCYVPLFKLYTKEYYDRLTTKYVLDNNIIPTKGYDTKFNYFGVDGVVEATNNIPSICAGIKFRTKEMAIYCGTQFIEIWLQFKLKQTKI